MNFPSVLKWLITRNTARKRHTTALTSRRMGGAGGSGGVTGAAAFLGLVEVVFLEAVELFFAVGEEEPDFLVCAIDMSFLL